MSLEKTTGNLDTKLELVKLRVDFALHKMGTENISMQDALKKYAGAYKILKGVPQDIADKILFLVSDVRDSDALAKLLLATKRKFTSEDSEDRLECFYYDVRKEVQAYLHFNNSICPRHPMNGAEIENRKVELTDIARDLSTNMGYVKVLRSGSWIWSLKSFQALMPAEFVASLEETIRPSIYSNAQFGQFVRYDGTLNTERAEQFRTTWQFPVKTLQGECDIADFINLYCPNFK